jgi:hypothetical protein
MVSLNPTAIFNRTMHMTFICSGRGELSLTRALGGRPMASGGGGPRRLVASRGGSQAGDVQSHRPELQRRRRGGASCRGGGGGVEELATPGYSWRRRGGANHTGAWRSSGRHRLQRRRRRGGADHAGLQLDRGCWRADFTGWMAAEEAAAWRSRPRRAAIGPGLLAGGLHRADVGECRRVGWCRCWMMGRRQRR